MNKTIDELVKLNKMTHPELDGACYICGINPKVITQAMLDALPEKVDESSWERSIPKRQYNKGFNQAISEMETAIKKMGGSDAG